MLLLVAGIGSPSSAFDLSDVEARARELVGRRYERPEPIPQWLRDLSYDAWRSMRFRPDEALWRGRSRFEVQFFHPGAFYERSVRVSVVDAEGVHPVPFHPSQYSYGDDGVASRVPQDLGHAGFRLHYPLKTEGYADEVAVFLGASYFRSLGREEVWGLSARGLAIDTATPSGEEFPWFREFWIVRPSPGAESVAVYALLDGPRVTGAFRFAIVPGAETRVDVQSRIFRREPVGKLGIAPLTSMFLHGDTSAPRHSDYRPEVHDSDGLLIETGAGEWTFRPIENPRRLRVSVHQVARLMGFGLIQRDRNFDHYRDLEAHYEMRPSAWVEPAEDWGPGAVELVEIPTSGEDNDNIVAYWVPASVPDPPAPLAFDYRLHWYGDAPERPPRGRVVAVGRDQPEEGIERFVIDFAGEKLRRLPAETVVRGVVEVRLGDSHAQPVEQQTIHNPETGGFRLVLRLEAPEGPAPAIVRARLEHADEVLTEVFTAEVSPP